MATKTNSGLVAYAKAQVGLPYWYGTFGQTASESLYNSKAKQYASKGYYTKWTDYDTQYGKRVHDCVGLIKGYIWSASATATPVYNSAQDKSACGMYTASSSDHRGKIATFPAAAGLLLYKSTSSSNASGIHHVGVYGGDGYVYEAKGHEEGVVKTAYKKSDWQFWSQCPYCEDDTTEDEVTIEDEDWTPAVGDTVNYNGIVHYSSSNSTTPKTCKSGKAKITNISKTGKHPYHLVKVSGGTSTVYGWVDAGTFTKA